MKKFILSSLLVLGMVGHMFGAVLSGTVVTGTTNTLLSVGPLHVNSFSFYANTLSSNCFVALLDGPSLNKTNMFSISPYTNYTYQAVTTTANVIDPTTGYTNVNTIIGITRVTNNWANTSNAYKVVWSGLMQTNVNVTVNFNALQFCTHGLIISNAVNGGNFVYSADVSLMR